MSTFRLDYLNIIDASAFDKYKRSNTSLFSTLFAKPTFGHKKLRNVYKKTGLKLSRSLTFRKASATMLRSVNYAAYQLDGRTFYDNLVQQNIEHLQTRRNLKYYLAVNNLPRNGQRTRNNAKTAKRLGFYNSIAKSNYKPRQKRVSRKVKGVSLPVVKGRS